VNFRLEAGESHWTVYAALAVLLALPLLAASVRARSLAVQRPWRSP
jgi:hypothetical protein